MSAEYRPVADLAFHTIDKRLEKYGIKVEFRDAVTDLIGPFGILFANSEGSSTHFERAIGVNTQAVIDAIEMEYGIKIVDENDHRFWGFATEDDLIKAHRGASEVTHRQWAVVEGPSILDAEFTASWLMAAARADAALDAYLQTNPRSREALFCHELPTAIKLGEWAMAFVGRWLKGQGIFEIDLRELDDGEMFCIMLASGFFVRTGERYQMTIPRHVNIVGIRDGLVQLADTRDDAANLHPERLLVRLTKSEAETRKIRLLALDLRQRLADRDDLLESYI